jgi:YfiH family protein
MPFHLQDQIKYYVFPTLEEHGLNHAVFTRQGGVSAAPFHYLNVGGTVGDEPEHVSENRRRSFNALGREIASLHDVWQVHSAQVVIAAEPRHPQTPHVKADILITDNPRVTLTMRFADCVPILLYDPVRKAVGLAHAGWVGTLKKVARVAVKAMVNAYHCNPGDILAGIGPSICMEHYPVGDEVVIKAREAFGDQADLVLEKRDGKFHFNLWKANQLILEESGLDQIELSGLCTACHLEDWFSHRGENGRTGRFGALINL